MDDEPRSPLPWEAKVAVGFLTLLCLMEVQEGYLYLAREAARSRLGSAWTILLLLFLGSAVGLWLRSRTAWWLAVVLVGTIGLLHIGETLAAVAPPPDPPRRPGVIECAVRPPFDQFKGVWLVLRNGLLLAVPSLLLLGRLRERLRPTP